MLRKFVVYSLDEPTVMVGDKENEVVEEVKTGVSVFPKCCDNPNILFDICGCQICDNCNELYQCEECYAHTYSAVY